MSGPEGSSIKKYRLCVMVFIFRGKKMNDEEYMEIAYQEALKALEYDDVPIGCIIVKDDEIIAKAYNQREHLNQTYGHAEMLAIEKACQKIGRWRLDECTLYTTLEPCLMCSGAIIQSHIQRVVYGASDTRWMSLDKLIHLPDPKLNYIPMIQSDILKDKCSKLIKDYFKKKRQKI